MVKKWKKKKKTTLILDQNSHQGSIEDKQDLYSCPGYIDPVRLDDVPECSAAVSKMRAQ